MISDQPSPHLETQNLSLYLDVDPVVLGATF